MSSYESDHCLHIQTLHQINVTSYSNTTSNQRYFIFKHYIKSTLLHIQTLHQINVTSYSNTTSNQRYFSPQFSLIMAKFPNISLLFPTPKYKLSNNFFSIFSCDHGHSFTKVSSTSFSHEIVIKSISFY